MGTRPGRTSGFPRWRIREWNGRQQLVAQWQQIASPPMRKDAEVADAHKARRQHVQQKAPQEFFDRQTHPSLLVLVRRVAPAESHASVGQRYEPVIGDGHAVGVAAEIMQRMLGAAEGRLGINDPVVAIQRANPGRKRPGLREWGECAMEAELARCMQLAQARDKLAAEDTAEHFHTQEETVLASDPAAVIESQSTGRNHTMDMRMVASTPTIP